MKNKLALFALIVLITAGLAGCYYIHFPDVEEDPARVNGYPDSIKEYLNGIGHTVYDISGGQEAEPDPINGLPKEAQTRLSELGGMEYKGGFTFTLEQSGQAVHLHNDIISPVGYEMSSAEWNMGGLTLLFSKILDEGHIVQFTTASYEFDTADVLMEQGDYCGFVYTSAEKDAGFGENKGCMIIIEKGTESNGDPHMYIWSYDRVFGAGRLGLSVPSDEKVYKNYKEYGGDSEDDKAIIKWY